MMPRAVLPGKIQRVMRAMWGRTISVVDQPQAVVQTLTQAMVVQTPPALETIKWDFPVLARHMMCVVVTQQILIPQRRIVPLGFFVAMVLAGGHQEERQAAAGIAPD